MDSPVTVTESKAHTDTEQASLYFKLKVLDNSLNNLKQASVFNKAQHAEKSIEYTRDTLGAIVSALHALMNENTRINLKLQKTNENLKRVNKVMGFAHVE